MQKLILSICILSWKSKKSIANTLLSYQKNGLLDLSDDIVILFQECSSGDKKIAEKFGIKHIDLSENIGIGKGISKLIENAKYETVLFLEHDWELIENQKTVSSQLQEGLNMLKHGYDIVRYRSRSNQGYPVHSIRHKGKELEYYDTWHKVNAPQLLESMYWLDPAVSFPDKIQKSGNFFVTTSRWANWTNNPLLLQKSFFKKNIQNIAEKSEHFERDIAEWWVQQNFIIAQGEGLFMHNDIDKHAEPTMIEKIIRKVKRRLQ